MQQLRLVTLWHEKIFTCRSSLSRWRLRRVCVPPLRSPAGYLFAGTRRLNAAVRAPLPGGYASQLVRMSYLTSTRGFLLLAHAAPRVHSRYLQRLCADTLDRASTVHSFLSTLAL